MNLQFYFEKGKQKAKQNKKRGKIGDHRIPLEETSFIYKSNMLPIPPQVLRVSK